VSMLRAAIVGLGRWGTLLVDSVQRKSEHIKFTVGNTRSPAKVEAFCRERAIRLVDDYDAVLADGAVDAIVLATPHSQHGDQIRRAAAAGKHVFVEKPFTLNSRDAEAALASAAAANIVLAVGFNRRFHPSMAELRKYVRDGRLGVIECCIAEQTAGGGGAIQPGAWRADPSETPAGAMTGIGIHIVDAMISLFGRAREAQCITTRRVAEHVDDTTAVLVRFGNGVSGLFFCSLVTVPNYRFAVYGSNGLAEILKPTLEDFRFAPKPDPSAGHLAIVEPEIVSNPGFDTLHAELTAFAACIRDRTPYPISADEVLHGVEAFEAIVESARIGKAVAVR
jgi:predicted dehydrogenase